MSSAICVDWWAREDLGFRDGRLMFAGRFADEIAREHGTPTFAYDGQRVVQNAARIGLALDRAGFEGRRSLYYAMKANRFAPLLTYLKSTGICGIDACSPNELQHATSCGFRPQEISLTATNLSDQDLIRASRFDRLKLNLDSVSAIRRWGRIRPGSTIGLRINPGLGVSRAGNAMLQYSRDDTTKFGIYREQFDSALRACREFDLLVDTIHFHTGCGFLNGQLDQLDRVIEHCLWFIDQVGTLETVNVGGGLGVPHVAEDRPLDLDRWAEILGNHFLPRSLRVAVEPGDYLVKDAGILLLTVNTVEVRRSKKFVGVDAGFNIAPEPAVYALPFEPIRLQACLDPAERGPAERGPAERVTLAGNINEALDIFYDDIVMSPIHEGDQLALLNAGAYSSSMSSNHCMRGEFKEILVL